MLKNKLIIALLSFFILENLTAQIITDRPDQTESSSTVGNGNLQIESGILIGFEGEAQTSNRQILAPTNLFRFGISKSIEIRLLSQYEIRKNDNLNVDGISDLEIGTKIQIFKNAKSSTEIAFLSHLIVPTGSAELSNDKFGTINKLSISHELFENIAIGYNLGYDNFGQGKGDFTYSLAVGFGINDKVGIYIEPFGEIVEFEDYISNFDAGVTYLANENMQFDFSFGTGLNNKMNYVSIGFSWLIEKG